VSKISACFSYSFVKPKQPANLVMFCETRPAIPEEEGAEYLKKCAQYARHSRVYLVPGLFILRERLCSCLISPEGKVIALQKASYPNLLQHPNLGGGEKIHVFDSEFGRIALLVDVDIFHPEAVRCAAMQGAEVLFATQYFDLYDLTLPRLRSGCWAMAQEHQLPILMVSNQNCCVCAPAPATSDKDGYILPPTAEFPALATVYPHKSAKVRQQSGLLPSLNAEFCARYSAQLGR
jgi:predicted amidohydrolase